VSQTRLPAPPRIQRAFHLIAASETMLDVLSAGLYQPNASE
jgi:hypothetical protein